VLALFQPLPKKRGIEFETIKLVLEVMNNLDRSPSESPQRLVIFGF
jgi:hypothetical protein